MIGGPIIRREVGSVLGRRRTAVGLILYVGLLSAGLLWLWPEEEIYSLWARSSRTISRLFVSALLFAILAVAPALSAVSIVSEKERRTWDLLGHTALAPHELVLAKFLSAMVLPLLLLAISFPFHAFTFWLGAATASETARLYALLTLSAAAATALGLAVSAAARDSHTALIRGYAGLAVWLAAPLVLGSLLGARPDRALWAQRIRAISPLVPLHATLLPPPPIPGLPSPQSLFLRFAGFMTLASLGFAWFRIRGPIREPRQPEHVIEDPRQLVRRRYRFPFYLIDPQRRRRLLPDHANPVLARELRVRALTSGPWLIRGLYLSFSVSAALVILIAGQLSGFSPDQLKAIALAFQIGLVALVGPALTAGAVTREVEANLFDALRMTRVSAWTLLSGKLLAGALVLLFLAAGAVPLWAVIYVMELNTWREIAVAATIIATTALFALTSGMFASAHARHTSAAAAMAYAIVLVFTAATLISWLAPDRFTAAGRTALEQWNPFLVAWSVLRTDAGRVLDPWRHLRFSLALSAVWGVLSYVRLHLRFAPDR